MYTASLPATASTSGMRAAFAAANGASCSVVISSKLPGLIKPPGGDVMKRTCESNVASSVGAQGCTRGKGRNVPSFTRKKERKKERKKRRMGRRPIPKHRCPLKVSTKGGT